MNEYSIRRARPIAAEMRVPGDAVISQRALVLAALANGPSVLTGFLPAEECLDTIQALRPLGVKFDYLSARDSDLPWSQDGRTGAAGPSRLRVHGVGRKLSVQAGLVDCGRSGGSLLLLTGLLAGQPFPAKLSGAAGPALLSVINALKKMGAVIKETGGVVEVTGTAPLAGTAITPGISPASARDAVLLAGLFAEGRTTVTDAVAGPDHLERLLHYYQVKTVRTGAAVSVWGGQMPESRDLHIPGDFSYAAVFIAAAAAQEGSILTVRGVGLNATRTAFLRTLVRMGAQVMEEISDGRAGEPQGNVIVRGAGLRGTVVEARETEAVGQELPVLMAVAALAAGNTVIHQTPATADRMARMTHNLRLMGVEVASLTQGITIKGQSGKPLQPGLVASAGDPGIALASALAGLFTDGETIVEDVACVESRWFGFGRDLERFQSREISEGHFTPMLQVMVRAPKTGRGKPGRSAPLEAAE